MLVGLLMLIGGRWVQCTFHLGLDTRDLADIILLL